MKKLLSFLTALIVLLQFISFAQQNSPSSANNIQVAFPFFDNVEDTTTLSASWTRDTNVWQIKIVSAHFCDDQNL